MTLSLRWWGASCNRQLPDVGLCNSPVVDMDEDNHVKASWKQQCGQPYANDWPDILSPAAQAAWVVLLLFKTYMRHSYQIRNTTIKHRLSKVHLALGRVSSCCIIFQLLCLCLPWMSNSSVNNSAPCLSISGALPVKSLAGQVVVSPLMVFTVHVFERF